MSVESHVLEGGKRALAMAENITLEYHAPHFPEEIGKILAPYRFHLVNHNQDKAILSVSKNLPRSQQVFAPTEDRGHAAAA
jgi:hypothetical protein